MSSYWDVEPLSCGALGKYCTSCSGMYLLDATDQFLAHVVLFHCGPQCVMPNSVKCLLVVNEDMVEFSLVLEMLHKGCAG